MKFLFLLSLAACAATVFAAPVDLDHANDNQVAITGVEHSENGLYIQKRRYYNDEEGDEYYDEDEDYYDEYEDDDYYGDRYHDDEDGEERDNDRHNTENENENENEKEESSGHTQTSTSNKAASKEA